MNMLSFEALAAYWSAPEVATNILIFFNLVGALLLGLLVGYERTYHGRVAGMRTYGLVCIASAALTVIAGYPGFWYGGQAAVAVNPDPTRVVQGIVTGIGFLGAGVIVNEGYSITGLNTAASIWAASAIGIMVGIGFYAAAILLALLSALCMSLVIKLEARLPSRSGVAVMVRFKKRFLPRDDVLRGVALEQGYEIAGGSLSITFQDGHPEWHFVAKALDRKKGASVAALAKLMTHYVGVERFHLSHARH